MWRFAKPTKTSDVTGWQGHTLKAVVPAAWEPGWGLMLKRTWGNLNREPIRLTPVTTTATLDVEVTVVQAIRETLGSTVSLMPAGPEHPTPPTSLAVGKALRGAPWWLRAAVAPLLKTTPFVVQHRARDGAPVGISMTDQGPQHLVRTPWWLKKPQAPTAVVHINAAKTIVSRSPWWLRQGQQAPLPPRQPVPVVAQAPLAPATKWWVRPILNATPAHLATQPALTNTSTATSAPPISHAAMKRLMTVEVDDAIAQLRADTSGTDDDFVALRTWLGDTTVTDGLEAHAQQVAESSAVQYDMAVRQYFQFCTRTRGTKWSDPFMLHFSYEEKVLWVTCWLQWQNSKGSNVDNSCSGLRFFFKRLRQPVDFFDDPRLRNVKDASRLSAMDLILKRQKNHKTLVPIEMLWTIMRNLGPRTPDDRSPFDRVLMYALLALIMYEYGYGLRISNLAVSNGRSTHTLLVDTVKFYFTDYIDPSAPDKGFYAFEVWLEVNHLQCTLTLLVAVVLMSPTGKNWGSQRDQKKKPLVNNVRRDVRPSVHDNTEMTSGGFQDQLCAILFEHAQGARLVKGQFFFSVNRGHLNTRAMQISSEPAGQPSHTRLGRHR